MPNLPIATVMALLLTACVTQQEREAVSSAWSQCIMDAVRRLDDGKTDPVSMAYGIAPQCAIHYNNLSQAMIGDYITDAGQANMRGLMRDGELKMVTSAILTYRRSRAK